VVKILNAHVYVWRSLFYVYVLKIKDWLTCEEGLAVHDYNALDEVLLRVLARGRARAKCGGDVDGVFCTPNMFITLWFGFVCGTNPPLGTLII
jgi:hypothetical protein